MSKKANIVRRFFALLMTLVLFSQCYLLAHAASISADDSEVIVHDAQKVQQIDELLP
jgi:hypothetical protein